MLSFMATTKPALFLRVDPVLRARLVAGAANEGVSLNAYCERLLHLGHEYLITTKENSES